MEEINKIKDEIFPNGSPLDKFKLSEESETLIVEANKGEFLTGIKETVTKSFDFFRDNNIAEFVERLRETNNPFSKIFEKMEIESFYLDQISNKQEIEKLTREKFNISADKKCIVSIKFE